jgi:hypothetical protein
MKFLINEEFATADTDTTEHIQNEREELNIIDRAGKTEVSKMTRAVMICLTATAACFSII